MIDKLIALSLRNRVIVIAGYLALAAWGFGIDTGAHFLRLVFAGVFDAFPKLTVILGHLGEGLPFMLHRIQDQTQLAAQRRGLKQLPPELTPFIKRIK